MNEMRAKKSIFGLVTRNPHFSTLRHRPAPPAESWELPFVFSFRAPLGLSIKKEFADFDTPARNGEVFGSVKCLLLVACCCLLLVAC